MSVSPSSSKIINNEKNETKIPQTEAPKEKTYINCFCIKIDAGVFISYIYIFLSVSLTLVNRVLFQKFNFKFNFLLLFFQQLFCLLFFKFVASKNKNFIKSAGEISFSNFKKFKFYYLFFTFIFAGNFLISFIANQLVKNIVIFLCLRKLLTIMNYLYDRFVKKKELPKYFTVSVLLLTAGVILSAIDDMTADYLGYFLVIVNNIFTLFFTNMGESFRKKTGLTNINLLVYNSYIITPFLLVLVIVSGDLTKFVNYLDGKNTTWIISLCINLLVSCLLGVSLNTSNMCSLEKTSSLFNVILSNCKDVIISPISYFILKDHRITYKTVLSLILSFIGVIIFQYKTIQNYFKVDKNKNKEEPNQKKIKIQSKEDTEKDNKNIVTENKYSTLENTESEQLEKHNADYDINKNLGLENQLGSKE